MIHYDAPGFARRYARGRRISPGAARVWIDAIVAAIGGSNIGSIVDVGCGTGRFLRPLSDAFSCRIVGIDRSSSMLREAQRDAGARVRLVCCDAARIPMRDGEFDLAFISMAYHHFRVPADVLREIRRTLHGRGFLCLRNSTRDAVDGISYLRFFPSALAYCRERLPTRQEIVETAASCSLALREHTIIDHVVAASKREYLDKIARRVNSDLVATTDDEFESGLEAMEQALSDSVGTWPVTEPIDFFVFQNAYAA